MNNERVNEIMCDYVTKASDFCKSYEKEVLAKKYGCMSSVIEAIYSDLESKLYNLVDETKAKLESEIIKCSNWDKSLDDLRGTENDLLAMHKYYTHMYSARIAEGLAKQWREIANNASMDMFIREAKGLYLIHLEVKTMASIKIIDFTRAGEIQGKRVTLEDLAKDPIRCVVLDLGKELEAATLDFEEPEELRKYAIYSIERALADIKFLSLLYGVIFDKGELSDYVKNYIDICHKWLKKYKEVGDDGKH